MSYDFPSSPSVGTIYAPAGGPAWQWNGTGWATVSPTGLVVGNIVVTVIMGPATSNYVKPTNLKFVEVWIVGGGGGGSRAGATAATTSSAGAGGGGAGMAYSLYAASDLAASEPYVVGAGAVQTGVGVAGGNSTFKGMTANGGGGGGALMTAGTGFQRSATRGGGGGATGGQVNILGGAGGWGYGGVHGSGTLAQGGCGGNSFFAIASIDMAIGPGSILGYDGRTPGGGGSGEGSGAGGAVGSGSAGANGMIMLKEYF